MSDWGLESTQGELEEIFKRNEIQFLIKALNWEGSNPHDNKGLYLDALKIAFLKNWIREPFGARSRFKTEHIGPLLKEFRQTHKSAETAKASQIAKAASQEMLNFQQETIWRGVGELQGLLQQLEKKSTIQKLQKKEKKKKEGDAFSGERKEILLKVLKTDIENPDREDETFALELKKALLKELIESPIKKRFRFAMKSIRDIGTKLFEEGGLTEEKRQLINSIIEKSYPSVMQFYKRHCQKSVKNLEELLSGLEKEQSGETLLQSPDNIIQGGNGNVGKWGRRMDSPR